MGSSRSRAGLIRLSSHAALVATGASFLATFWAPGAWWQWLGTSSFFLVAAATLSNAADEAEKRAARAGLASRLYANNICKYRPVVTPNWICVREDHPDEPKLHYMINDSGAQK